MFVLTSISIDSMPDFEDTSYAAMSDEDKRRMIQESSERLHDGTYFEILAISDDDRIVGFMNLYAHSAHTISIGPEIKNGFRRQGYGFRAETLALQYAKRFGYLTAVAEVCEDNAASIALHEKLGFMIEGCRKNKYGHPVRIYKKTL